MWLTDDEIRELTGFVHRAKQIEELNRLGIVHRERKDGSVIVARKHVDEQFGCSFSGETAAAPTPNWDAV